MIAACGLAPFQRHSETSRKAAIGIHDSKSTLRQKVLAYISSRGEEGATDEEVQIALNMNPSTQRPRRIELWRNSEIYEGSNKRETTSGRMATVWIAA